MSGSKPIGRPSASSTRKGSGVRARAGMLAASAWSIPLAETATSAHDTSLSEPTDVAVPLDRDPGVQRGAPFALHASRLERFSQGAGVSLRNPVHRQLHLLSHFVTDPG